MCLHVAVGVEQQICGLHVAVQKPSRVHEFERLECLRNQAHGGMICAALGGIPCQMLGLRANDQIWALDAECASGSLVGATCQRM